MPPRVSKKERMKQSMLITHVYYFTLNLYYYGQEFFSFRLLLVSRTFRSSTKRMQMK